MKLGHHKIGSNSPPLIIAEMSGNHNQSLERALKIVDAAASAGAHAIKIQTYTPDTMTMDLATDEFLISDSKSLWVGKTLYELYGEAYTPWEWHQPIFERANELGLLAFSTPFDATSVDFLEELNVPCYKIASFENTDIPLIRKVASTGKPLLISTGMATLAELDETVTAARESGCDEIVLLKCTSSYPSSPEHSNIATLPHMRNLFNCEVGLSDHTLGIGVAIAAATMGATVIEKHFTMDRRDGGVDANFSLEPAEMSSLVIETKRAWQSIGLIQYGPSESESKSLQFRRSLYLTRDIRSGEILTPQNLKCLRPGLGLAPKYYEMVIGCPIMQNAKKGTPLQWSHVINHK